jgi:hypothetical protein
MAASVMLAAKKAQNHLQKDIFLFDSLAGAKRGGPDYIMH